LFYDKNPDEVKRWKGYRLRGCDGSTLNLPDTANIRSFLVRIGNQSKCFAQAKIVYGYDVIIHSK